MNTTISWQNKLKHSLAEISSRYVEGCVAFYESQNPDPWRAELDTLEAMIKIGNELEIKKAIDVFERNCLKLIVGYKK